MVLLLNLFKLFQLHILGKKKWLNNPGRRNHTQNSLASGESSNHPTTESLQLLDYCPSFLTQSFFHFLFHFGTTTVAGWWMSLYFYGNQGWKMPISLSKVHSSKVRRKTERGVRSSWTFNYWNILLPNHYDPLQKLSLSSDSLQKQSSCTFILWGTLSSLCVKHALEIAYSTGQKNLSSRAQSGEPELAFDVFFRPF